MLRGNEKQLRFAFIVTCVSEKQQETKMGFKKN